MENKNESAEEKRYTPSQRLAKAERQQQSTVIKEEWYRIGLFPDYQAIMRGAAMLNRLGIRNPFFEVSERYVADTTMIGDKRYISYAAYNYLGFAGDPRVNEAVKEAVDRYGSSASASRVVGGERPIHQQLEDELAALLGTEKCLVLVGGYNTNVTVIGHLLGAKDLVVHDSLCHNSIVTGSVLSGAERFAFPHNDVAALEEILKRNRARYQRVLIVIEGIYSMDGDIAPLPQIIELRRKYKTLLMIDEAHSIGVLGKTGRGIGEHYGVKREEVDIWMGTLSKAFAGCGGYIAGSQELIMLLKSTVPGFFFSVGMSPPDAAAALASARLLTHEPERVDKLRSNSRLLLTLAKGKGLNTGLSHDSPVVPVIIGNSIRCLRICDALFKRGLSVQPAFAPAVAEAASRLRFFVTCKHTEEQIRFTIDAVAECLEEASTQADVVQNVLV